MRFFQVREDQLNEIAQLIQEFFHYHQELNRSERRMSFKEARETALLWIKKGELYALFRNDEPLGFVRVREDSGTYWIENLGVSSRHQGKGCGRILLEKVAELVQKKGQDSLYTFVLPHNTSALDFYRQNGFDVVNMVELRKDLRSTKKGDDEYTSLDLFGRKFLMRKPRSSD